MSEPYVSTVVPAGYSRYLVRMGAAPIAVIDVPTGQGKYVPGLAHRWLLGEQLPESVHIWPYPDKT